MKIAVGQINPIVGDVTHWVLSDLYSQGKASKSRWKKPGLTLQEDIEDVFPLPYDLIRADDTFMLNVTGESMIGAGILDGDKLIVKKQSYAADGDYVVAQRPASVRHIGVIAKNILKPFNIPHSTVERVVWLVYNHMALPLPRHKSIVKWLQKRAGAFQGRQDLEEAVDQLLILCRADVSAGKTAPDFAAVEALAQGFAKVLEEVPFYPADLDLDGEEVAGKLGTGPQVGRFFNVLLERVQKGELENEQSVLREALAKKAQGIL